MRLRTVSTLLLMLSVHGCGDDDDAAPDATASCVSDTDCDDGVFCNGAERCDLDAIGCVTGTSPCAAGRRCDETVDECGAACSDTDADGDGAAAIECGGTDCDDTDPNRYAGNAEICDVDGHDEDCDPRTFGSRDLDADGFVDSRCCNEENCGEDCDETRRGTNPIVPEVCDGRDNDCDGTVDEGLLQSVFSDLDRDLHGDPDAPLLACPGRVGTSASMLDCDDDDPMTNGPQQEIRDGNDNDCDGRVDEGPVDHVWYVDADGDGYGDPTSETMTSDTQPSGYALLPLDCDDDNGARSPRAPEMCNGLDDDCDGEANFVLGVNDWEDDDRDGHPDSACGGDDCDDTDPITFFGAAERCDSRDNDCDGRIDEECSVTVDAGTSFDAGLPVDAWTPADDAATLCSTSSECDDGVVCNGVELCLPEASGADAHGCVSPDVPCTADGGVDGGTDSGTCAPSPTGDRRWASYPLPGTPGHPRSYSIGFEVVVDCVTGLQWQRAVDAASYTHSGAESYCGGLMLAGFDDWRLPSTIELLTLIDHSLAPSLALIDPSAFPATPAIRFWASGEQAGMVANRWYVDFISGDAASRSNITTYRVRCVR